MKDNFEVALTKCFFCGENDKIVMNTRLNSRVAGAVKKAHGKVIDYEPCNDCKENMKKGVMVIETKDGEKGHNPFRTGRIAVIKDDAIKELITDEVLLGDVLDKRMMYIHESTSNQIHLFNHMKGE